MFTTTRRLIFIALAVVAVLLYWATPFRGAAADDAVPTATPLAISPEPTVLVATEAVPIPTSTPLAAPTAIREQYTPIPTPTYFPTVAEGPPPGTAPTRTAKAANQSSAPSTAVPTSPAVAPSSVPPEAPLPSPAELKQNARLRWGKGVPKSVRRWAFLIVPAARRYHLNAGLLAAVMTMESDGDPLAYSPADARGLMQVLHGPWDPRENVFTGARLLAEYHALFPSWKLTLAAYNAGPNAVSEYNGVPPYRETRDYVIVVSYLWDLYSHKHVSPKRKSLYHATLRDLQHFGRQRARVRKLALLAHIQDPSLECPSNECAPVKAPRFFANMDPFWPLPVGPDPLQLVDPYAGSP